MTATEEEVAEFFRAFRERAKGYGRPGPRPHYDPGAPSLPKPLTDELPPKPFTEADNDEGEP